MKSTFNCFLMLLIALFTTAQNKLKAQDTLKLLNGNVLNVQIQKLDDRSIYYLETFKGRQNERSRELNTIFSYKKSGQEELFVYEYNPERGNIYNLEEMKDFMLGEQHASKHYKSTLSSILGLGSGIFAGYALAENEELIFIGAPLVVSTVILIPGTRVKKHPINLNLRKNEAYRNGYKRVAKGKKFLNSFKLSALGMAASFAIFKSTD